MNKNLFLALALCATLSSSLVVSMDSDSLVVSVNSDVPLKSDFPAVAVALENTEGDSSASAGALSTVGRSTSPDVLDVATRGYYSSSAKSDKTEVSAPVAPSLYTRLTTLKGNPLRVSTQFPVVAEYAKGWTPCVDAACAGFVAAGLGYGLYSQRATLARGGKSVASGVATVASATKSGLVSAAKATPGAVKYGTGSAVSVAGKVGSVALYPVKEAFAHKTATVVGATSVVAIAMVDAHVFPARQQ